MSKEQKTVKILSLLFLVVGIFRIALGCAFFMAPEADFKAVGVLPFATSTNAVKMISVGFMLVYGLITVYFGWTGAHVANRPRNIEKYIKLCYFFILLLVVEALIPTSNHIAALVTLVISMVMVIIALMNARKIAARADQ